MKTVCICGAGTMGSGIAQVAAAAGFYTILYDVEEAMLERSSQKLSGVLQMLAGKQKITEAQKNATWANLHFTNNPAHCVADIVIEAIVEKADVKIALFNQLASINSAQTIFATNTSSLSVTSIAQQFRGSQSVAGLHFFNPAPLMKLVEVVKTESTPAAVVEQLVAFTKKMGKIPVVCKDAPGFIVNRVARPFYIEALRLAEENVADFETIDRLLENQGFKLGPFKLMDLIGNDVNYAVSCLVYEQLGRPERLKPSDIQKQKVVQNQLGKKTGCGYYNYQQ